VVIAHTILPIGIGNPCLLGVQHVAMFPAMFGVMLFRRDEYTHRPRRDG
jgi:hypothetical protein